MMMFSDPMQTFARQHSPAPVALDTAMARVPVRPATSDLRRFDDLCGSEIIHASFNQRSFAPHTHDTWTIGWVEHGANCFRSGRTQWIAAAGMVCVVNPGEAHTGGGEAMTYWNLMPSPALLARIFPETPLEHLFMRDAVLASGSAVAAVADMFRALGGADDALAREQAVVDGLMGLFGSGARIAAGDRHSACVPAAAAIARDYIEAHCADTVSLASLAALTGLSMFHLSRVFAAAHHMPPAAYVRNCRVQRAQRLIEAGVALADAAAMAGFADQPHMTRQFRAVLGVTPAQWRA